MNVDFDLAVLPKVKLRALMQAKLQAEALLRYGHHPILYSIALVVLKNLLK